MITDVLEHIGLFIKTQNDVFIMYGVNCIKDSKGRVMYEFTNESEYKGLTDTKDASFYLRYNGNFTYAEAVKSSSCKNTQYNIQVPVRLGVFAVNRKYNPYAFEQKLRYDLQNINWSTYVGDEKNIKVTLNSANMEFRKVFEEEFGIVYEHTAPLMFLYIDFTLELKQSQACNEVELCTNLIECC